MRITPEEKFLDAPCTIVAVGCAYGSKKKVVEVAKKLKLPYKEDGYLTLQGTNKLTRTLLKVKKYVYFKRGERMTLTQFIKQSKGNPAIIMVYGHCIYCDGVDYYSFFNNDKDQVVAVWLLETE